MWLTRVVSAIIFLFAIIFTIPLTFDVGGRTAGLAFSLSLAIFYFSYSVLRIATPDHSRFRYALCRIIAWTQWIVIPTLMIWALNKFSVDSDNAGNWVERRTLGKEEPETLQEHIFGPEGLLESILIGGWDRTLRYAAPVFQIAEGFCTLLAIQACGQITRWLVNRERGDSWMIGLLVVSATILSSSFYFLWRITTFPQIDNIDAILIGAAITCAVFLGSWGIGSGRGNPVESSLLFAYVTLCIYQIFTDYLPSAGASPAPEQPALPPLPPIIMASYKTLLHLLGSLPSTIHFAWSMIVGAFMTITPSVIISLAYRVFVMYASARIIPAVRESGARALSQEPSLEDTDEASWFLGLLSWFSPTILISVYTSLLMQHFASTNGEGVAGDWWKSQGGDVGGNHWRWINLAITMALYTLELYLGKEDDDGRLTSHWKAD